MQVRRATMEDVFEMQNCNLRCLPENYNLRYFYYHYISWPQLLHVCEDTNGKIVGYVLAKMDDEEDDEKRHGHITSLAVLRSHRKLGVATRVMKGALEEMDTQYKAHYCSLHVRRTNEAALHLYQESLGFRCVEIDAEYYMDNEDAYHMKRAFRPEGGVQQGSLVLPDGTLYRPPRPTTTSTAGGAGATAGAAVGGATGADAASGNKQEAGGGGGKKGKKGK